MRSNFFLTIFLLSALASVACAESNRSGIQKLEDVVIYKDEKFHSAFPSVIRRPGGELFLAFRRAPDWRPFGAKSYTHTDPNSHLVSVISKDGGKTWSKEPKLIYADPFGGSQDPCLIQLKDDSILCATYGWSYVPEEVFPKLKNPVFNHNQFVFLGGKILRSTDGGKSWEMPITPPTVEKEARLDLFGRQTPAYNRGAMCEGKDGRLFWVVASHTSTNSSLTSTHLMISDDKGQTWKYSCPVAEDEKVTFNESSIYETLNGDLIAFMRTADFGDKTCIARSTDGGKSFQKWQDAGFQGHPHFALRLPDQRVLLVYGYRHAPMGVRARVLDAECTNFSTEEIILRDDGGVSDLGYPWATMIDKDRAMVVYYFNQANGTRYIAGTFVIVK